MGVMSLFELFDEIVLLESLATKVFSDIVAQIVKSTGLWWISELSGLPFRWGFVHTHYSTADTMAEPPGGVWRRR
jgi:hypothetical protein